MSRAARYLLGALGLAGFIAILELASRLGVVDRTALPPATTFLREAGELAADQEFLTDLRVTLQAWAAGLLLAAAVAVPLGLLLGQVAWVGAATRIVVELGRPIPSVALIPLVLVMFSSATQQKMSLVFYAGLWPILINTLYAMWDADPIAKDTLRAFGFGPLHVLWRVTLPSAAPFVATGVRISASIGLIVVISTELLAGGDGIGTFLTESQSGGGDAALLLAGAVWAGVLGLAVNFGLVWLDRRLFRWAHATAGGGAP